jgi:cell division protein FtsL
MRDHKVAVSMTRMVKVHIGVLLTAAIFSLVYLVQVNAMATKGYAIREIEQSIAQKKKANERIGLDIIQAQSIENLQKKMDELKLVQSQRIDYITSGAPVATLSGVTP